MGLLDTIEGVAGGAVSNVTIESAAWFPISIDSPLTPATPDDSGTPSTPSAGPPLWARILRPTITVQTPAGPLTIAPGGPAPGIPWLLGAVVLFVFCAGYGAAKLLAPAVGAVAAKLPV